MMFSAHKVGKKKTGAPSFMPRFEHTTFSSVRDKTQYPYNSMILIVRTTTVQHYREKSNDPGMDFGARGGGGSATAGSLPHLVSTSAAPFPLRVGSPLATLPAAVTVDTLCRPLPPHHAIYSNSNPPPTRYDRTFAVYVFTIIETNYRKSAPRPATLDTHGPLIGPYNHLLLGEYPLLIVIELP